MRVFAGLSCRVRRSFFAFAAMTIAASGCARDTTSDDESSRDAFTSGDFVSWVRDNATPLRTVDPKGDEGDLKALGDLVGDARVFGFGEADHGGHEQPQMRNRIFRYVAKNKGFRVVMLESDSWKG